MHKLFLAVTILVALTLAALAMTTATRADNPRNGRPSQGRFQRIVFGTKPSISDLEDLIRLPLDPFGTSILSQLWNADCGLRNMDCGFSDSIGETPDSSPSNPQSAIRNPQSSDAWLLKRHILQRLSQSAQTYLLRKYVPQMRAPVNASHTINRVTLPAAAGTSKENIRVNNPSLDKDDRTQSETSAAVFGNNLVVSFNDSAGLEFKNLSGLSVSLDGGVSWRQTRIPTYPGGANLGDGVAAVDTRGNFYYSTIAADANDRITVGVSRSTDGGASWGRLTDGSTTAGKKGDFQDKEWMAVDHSPSSPFKDSVYLTWTDFQRSGKVQIMFARSKSHGRTFNPPKPIAESVKENGFVQGSMAVTGPNGELYIVWIDGEFGKSEIKIIKSTDGGKTFSAPTSLAAFRNPLYPANGIFDVPFPLPSMAVDLSTGPTRGNVYVTYPARPETPPDRADIFLVRSTNGGASWSAPRRLNDDLSVAEQLLPSIAVAEDGAVAATWYDRRNDLVNLSLVDVYATVSTDGGDSFAPNRRITTANWPLVPTPFNLRPGYHGDYSQLATRGKQFLFNWGDDRSGTDSDVYISFKTAEELAIPAPDFILSARTSFQAIKAGGVADFTIDTQSLYGADGSLTLEATPNMPGLSFSFNSADLPLGASTTLTVQTARELPAGPYLIGITARRGDQVRTTYTRLTVLDLDSLVKQPQNITNNRSGSLFPRSIIDEAGNIDLVWLDDSPGIFSIFFSRSTDGGKTFSAPLQLPRNPDSFIGAPLVVANEHEIYIGYLELFVEPDFVFKTMLTRSTDGGKTFSPARAISDDSGLFVVPETLQLDSDGAIHFGATTFRPPDPNKPVFTDFDVESTDGGATFRFNKIFEGPSPLSEPIVAVEGDGKTVRSLFADFDRAHGGLFFTRSTDGGVTFAPPVQIPAKLDNLLFAGAFFVPNGKTHVVYAEGDILAEDFHLFYTKSEESDRFGAPVEITGDALTVLSFGLAADTSGNVVAAFEGSFNKYFDEDYVSRVFYCNSTDGGTTFSKPKSFEPARGGDFSPVVLLDLTGEYSIIWDGFSRDATDIFYSLSPDKGRSFPLPVNLTENAGFSSYSDFAYDERGRFQLLWQDNTPGSFDIYRITLGKE